jgi:type II secretory ATPase GspE/PulE/Tfp pilus assembly ATPase PilB-like protein
LNRAQAQVELQRDCLVGLAFDGQSQHVAFIGSETVVSGNELVALGRPSERVGKRFLAHGRGCASCGGTGYRGRVAIFEVLQFNDEIRDLVAAGAPTLDIHRAAIAGGMRALRDDGNRLCLEGVTTLSEIQRVVGEA